jgi:hypothetical protein
MAKYVPKAKEVDADQVSEGMLDKTKGFTRVSVVRDGRTLIGNSFTGKNGREVVVPGDYIVTDGKELYAVEKDDFEALYKPARARKAE